MYFENCPCTEVLDLFHMGGILFRVVTIGSDNLRVKWVKGVAVVKGVTVVKGVKG